MARRLGCLGLLAGAALAGLGVEEVRAQYSAIAAPFNSANSSFSENIGVNWGFSGPNFFFNNGGGRVLPPFGNHDPNADASLGFALRGNNTNFFFNLTAGQGSSTTMTSQTPTIVVPNGVPGYLFDGQQRPFVTSVIPVVGAGSAMAAGPAPQVVSPLAERLSRLRAEQALREAAAHPHPAESAAAARPKDAGRIAPRTPQKDDPPLVLGVR